MTWVGRWIERKPALGIAAWEGFCHEKKKSLYSFWIQPILLLECEPCWENGNFSTVHSPPCAFALWVPRLERGDIWPGSVRGSSQLERRGAYPRGPVWKGLAAHFQSRTSVLSWKMTYSPLLRDSPLSPVQYRRRMTSGMSQVACFLWQDYESSHYSYRWNRHN